MTRRFITALAAGLLGCLSLPHSTHAAVYVSDGFDDGGLTDGADPQDAAWTASYGTNLITVGPYNTTGNTSNSLRYNPGSGNTFLVATGKYTAPALSVGDSILLSFDFRLTTITTGTTLRFGFGSTQDTITDMFGIGTNAAGQLTRYTAGNISGTATNIGAASAFAINDTNSHTFTLTLQRSADKTLTVSGNIDNAHPLTGTYTLGGNTSAYTTFNQILLGQGGTSAGFNIDNVVVASPEPASLAAIGLVGLLALRRRRTSGGTGWYSNL